LRRARVGGSPRWLKRNVFALILIIVVLFVG
jgi:hypothetical protein